ncbi:DNA polymerase III subunit chi [Rhodovulum strictum]|uniref:DNA polymerase III subunit chi n=1 Tax=Rhodovulum strictum TaxID=58314 RepID=A0A844B3L9_9RHOB|nr:DNA polymerase III subunit chi [Rhodovulum strictum]MRH20330.1 DNA polymerase III subunit chi [Rhodovulum strictum]
MGIVMFYHLTRRPIEATLPALLDKSLAQGWRVVVRGADAGRLDWLDELLWQGDGFLPHGRAGGAFDADQPVLLTTGPDIPNGAVCLMAVDGAQVTPQEAAAMERVCILFDGNDPVAVEAARGQWRALTGAGLRAQYWSEDSGRWEIRRDSGG